MIAPIGFKYLKIFNHDKRGDVFVVRFQRSSKPSIDRENFAIRLMNTFSKNLIVSQADEVLMVNISW